MQGAVLFGSMMRMQENVGYYWQPKLVSVLDFLSILKKTQEAIKTPCAKSEKFIQHHP
jgi:hypothetical protein